MLYNSGVSRVRTLTTEEERQAFEKFLLAHSGDGRARQCPRHPPIVKMTYPQLADVMQKELGFVPTRQTVSKTCRELGVARRPRPRLSDEERRQAEGQRQRRWAKKLRRDPVAWEAHLGRKRIAGKKAMEKLRMDPEAWEAFLKRRRGYLRNYRRRVREATAAA